MSIYYAKSTGGFYDAAIHGDPIIELVRTDPDTGETLDRWTERNPNCLIPADAVEITAEEHAELLAAQSTGKVIQPGPEGRPVVVDPPPPSLDEQRAAALARINLGCETAMAQLRANYPDSEVMSWSQQTAEANALAANHDAPTPLLTAIAAVRGINVADLAARVRAKRDAYAQASGQIIGQRQALEDTLNAIDLKADDAATKLEAVRWPSV